MTVCQNYLCVCRAGTFASAVTALCIVRTQHTLPISHKSQNVQGCRAHPPPPPRRGNDDAGTQFDSAMTERRRSVGIWIGSEHGCLSERLVIFVFPRG
jgi:hypothetical protein